jgi:hypothetical protein
MGTFPMLFILASAAVTQAGSADPQHIGSYDAVMHAQYAAHSLPVAQRAEEAKRVYEIYLNSIGEKTKSNSDNPPGSAGDSSH